MSMLKAALIFTPLALSLVACGAPPGPVNEPKATVRVEAIQVGEFFGGSSATAWYIAGDATYGVVATAGHVCQDGALYTLSDGNVALPLDPTYDHDEAETDDVCLLFTLTPGARVLPLAERPGAVGDQVEYYGYPAGLRAHYFGEVSDVNEDGSLVASIPTWYGSSGSALTRDGAVVGMLSTGVPDFGNLGTFTGLEALKAAKVAAEQWLVDQTVVD